LQRSDQAKLAGVVVSLMTLMMTMTMSLMVMVMVLLLVVVVVIVVMTRMQGSFLDRFLDPNGI
jgi:hypothetical protein